MSAEDITVGSRWGPAVSAELERSHFGIICLTPENLLRPWIHFEAGALSKVTSFSRVVPALFMTKEEDISSGPLGGFQARKLDKEGVLAILFSVNAVLERSLDEPVLSVQFERLWPDLLAKLEAIEKFDPTSAILDTRSPGFVSGNLENFGQAQYTKDGTPHGQKAEAETRIGDGLEITRTNSGGAWEIELRPTTSKRLTIGKIENRRYEVRFEAKVSGGPHYLRCISLGVDWQWINSVPFIVKSATWLTFKAELLVPPEKDVLFRLQETIDPASVGSTLHVRNVIVRPLEVK
ncbi:MAG TPA: hypothetical protein VHW60_21200 [Caulobacteraceae bacterium]|jgi:hypothetical protein|nr:hypothetical protein [Caulobacteraceae bacterium]